MRCKQKTNKRLPYMDRLGQTFDAIGDIPNAEKNYRQSINIRRAHVADDERRLTDMRFSLGQLLVRSAPYLYQNREDEKRTRMEEANKLLTLVSDIRKKMQPVNSQLLFESEIALAESEILSANLGKASERLANLKATSTNMQASQLSTYQRVVAFLAAQQGDQITAASMMAAHHKAVSDSVAINHPDSIVANLEFAEVLLAINKKPEAARLARQLKAGVLGTGDTFVEDAPQRKRLALLLASTADIAN
jgi:hypothetical protein